jgi:hypothetical protein
MKHLMILAAGFAALAGPALAQEVTPDWRAVSFVGRGDDEGLALIDIASIRRPTATLREIRAATVSERPAQISRGKSFSMTQVVYRFDCKSMTYSPLHTEAWSARGKVMSGDNEGPVRKVEAGSIMGDVHAAVCDGAFAHLRKVPGANPIASSLELIVQRQSLIDSRSRPGWQRLTDGGDAPDRLQYFAARGSVIGDGTGGRLVSTMVLIEKPEGGITRVHYLVRIDCRARTGETIYAEAFGAEGQPLSELLLNTGAQPLEPGRMAAALEVPVCRGDWNTGAPEIRLPEQLAREAFH